MCVGVAGYSAQKGQLLPTSAWRDTPVEGAYAVLVGQLDRAIKDR
jgi:hypothetical protein